MRQIRELLRLKYECGLSHARIAGALGLSKGVVAKYVKRLPESAWAGSRRAGSTRASSSGGFGAAPRGGAASGYVQPDFALLHQELKRKGVTLALLWEEYVQSAGRERPIATRSFCDHYRAVRPAPEALDAPDPPRRREAVHRLRRRHGADHRCGHRRDQRGRRSSWRCSGRRTTPSPAPPHARPQADWIGAHRQALSFIGGVPALIVPDNPRALIHRPDRYEPQLNRAVEEFAAHYGTAILPARPYRARDKPKVEVAVLVVAALDPRAAAQPRFFSLAELNAAIAELLRRAEPPSFKKLPGFARSAFASSRSPRTSSRCRPRASSMPSWKKARVNIDYHVEFEGHYYSVPHRLVRQQVEVRAHAHQRGVLRRRQARGRATPAATAAAATARCPSTCPRRTARTWSGRRGGCSTGGCDRPQYARVVRYLLEHKPHPEQGYRACLGLLRLARQYGAARLEAACARAHRIRAPTYRSVTSILKAGLGSPASASHRLKPSCNCPRTRTCAGPLTTTDAHPARRSTDAQRTHTHPTQSAAPGGHGPRLRGATHQTPRPAHCLRGAPRAAGASASSPSATTAAWSACSRPPKLKVSSACMRGHQLAPRTRLGQRHIAALAGGDWMRHAHNCLITGATGSGKTWLACALGKAAARKASRCSTCAAATVRRAAHRPRRRQLHPAPGAAGQDRSDRHRRLGIAPPSARPSATICSSCSTTASARARP